ncbi:MAG: ATP-binding protein [Bdellovibrio sp.]|jgi:DNA polymerase-3 subunit delta'
MARLLSSIRGNQQLIERLLSSLQNKQLPSTFLFVGPSGVGRRKVAKGLAQALVCERSSLACGECGPCLRVAQGVSEAVRVVSAEKTQIKIEQSREILDFLSLRAISNARIVIIDGAHNLNAQAGNALLKILEEPPENSYFFLIAPSARHVLPTLRSRSQIVRFGSLTEADLRSERPAPEWAVQSALGSFERLDAFLNPGEVKLRAQAWQILSKWNKDEPIFLEPESREWMKDRGSLLSLARYWIMAFRDAMMFQAGETHRLFNSDQKQGLAALAALPTEKLARLMRLALELEFGLSAQRDPQLSFEEFWILSRREGRSC